MMKYDKYDTDNYVENEHVTFDGRVSLLTNDFCC